jgi:hypothetical protein
MKAYIIQNSFVLFTLFNLGFLMAIMHAIMTRDSFEVLDKYFKTRWFGKDSWTNKHTWTLFGKVGLFKHWPLIVFTDLFHLAHCTFALNLGIILTLLIPNSNIYTMCILFFVYSASFELFYGTIFKNKNQ